MDEIALIVAAVVTLASTILLHRTFFRRSRFRLPPGPKPWPIVGNMPQIGGAPLHSLLAAMAGEYGSLMYLRLGSVGVVVAASAAVAEKLLKVHDTNFLSRPPNAGAKYIAYNYQDMVFAPYGPRWRLLRKISTVHLFSSKALDDHRRIREEEIAVLVQALASSGEVPAALGSLLTVCTANALGRTMIGRRVFGDGGSGDDSEAKQFKAMVEQVMILAGKFNPGDFFPSLEWLDLLGVASEMKKVHKWFDDFLTKIVEEHRNLLARGRGGGHQDLLSTLLSSAEDENEKINDTEIKALLLNMFTAGTDTSASTVEWALTELIRHPKMMAQAQQELDSVVGRDRAVSDLDLPQLVYLQAVVKETFRLHPPTPLSLPRMAAESCEINGYHIPKGTTLLVDVWAIGRDPKEWADPLEFRPNRFLPGGEKAHVDVKGNDFEVIPFGAGRRICVGMSMGLRMVQMLTATLVHYFDWALPNGLLPDELNMDEAYGLTLRRAQPLVVHPRPRLLPGVYQKSP
ncbi:flavonoid 3'-monooxygenase [Benincasa hispida]|uniref:flavonoid 3'-monooxygenase n=1 Tax=Benincasa hispida TaxID=102211 RepID=UPI001901DB44|nr:flavonoid 3'-monooxygenase [Benincasa hispida]